MNKDELVEVLMAHIESMPGYQDYDGGKWWMKVPDPLFPEPIQLTEWDKLHQRRNAEKFFEAIRRMQLDYETK